LSGHKDEILKLKFHTIKINEFEDIEVIVSTSKDNSLKIWNFRLQECMQTVSDLVHKVSNFLIINDILIIGSLDKKLKIYTFSTIVNQNITTYLVSKGSFHRQSTTKILSMEITNDQKLFSILSKDSSIEFFKILSNSEIKKRMINEELLSSNIKKREKLLNKEKITNASNNIKELLKTEKYNFKMKFFPLFKFFNDALITGVIFLNNNKKSNSYEFMISLKNNSLENYEISTKLLTENIYKDFDFGEELVVKINEDNLQINKNFVVSSYGHRDVIRLVKFGEEASLIFTASNESVRIWNLFLINVNKTIELERVVSGCFLLQDRYVCLFQINLKMIDCLRNKMWRIIPI